MIQVTQQSRDKRRAIFILRVGVSALILFLVSRNVSWQQLRFRLEHISVPGYLLVLLPLLAGTACVALRWKSIVDRIAGSMRYGDAWSVTMAGCALDQFFFSMSGDAYRGWWLSRNLTTVTRAVASVLLDRTAGVLGAALVILAFIPLFLQLNGGASLVWIPAGLSSALLAGFVCLLVLDRLPLAVAGNRWLTGLALLSSSARSVFMAPGSLACVTIAAATAHILVAASITLIAQALNVPLALGAALAVVPSAILIALFPISMGGWGVREGTLVFGLGIAGIGPADALAISLVYGVAAASVGAMGGLVWLLTDARRQSDDACAVTPGEKSNAHR